MCREALAVEPIRSALAQWPVLFRGMLRAVPLAGTMQTAPDLPVARANCVVHICDRVVKDYFFNHWRIQEAENTILLSVGSMLIMDRQQLHVREHQL